MTTRLNRIVSQAAVVAFVAVLACSASVRSDKAATQGNAQSATVTIADLDPLCGHHYPT